MSHIVPIGGADFDLGTGDLAIYRFLLELTGRPNPKACFLPTASGEPMDYVNMFRQCFDSLGCQTSWFSFFQPHTAAVRDFILEQDLIYVGGGNTKSMLALWREWGVDRFLKEANDNGTVLAGLSAGMICWFEQGITDSIPGPLTPLPCLGLLEGSASPHYDSEPERQPTFTRLINEGQCKPGYAADDHVALHFENGLFKEAHSWKEGARAFHVSPGNEERLAVRRLTIGL